VYKIPPTLGTEAALSWAGYTRAKLFAAVETRDLAKLIDFGIATLKAEEAVFVSAKETMNAALALRDLQNDASDRVVLGVSYVLKGLERSPGRWTKYILPDGVTPEIGGPVREQPSRMELMSGRLANADHAELRGSASTVIDSAAALRERNDAYDAARDQVAVAFSHVLDARIELIRAVEKVYGQLVDRYGKKAAERYFQKRPTKSSKKAAAKAE